MKKFLIFLVLVMGFCFFNYGTVDAQATTNSFCCIYFKGTSVSNKCVDSDSFRQGLKIADPEVYDCQNNYISPGEQATSSVPINLSYAFEAPSIWKKCEDFEGYISKSYLEISKDIDVGKEICRVGNENISKEFKEIIKYLDASLKIIEIDKAIENSTCCQAIPNDIECHKPFPSSDVDTQLKNSKSAFFIADYVTCVKGKEHYDPSAVQDDGQGHKWTLYSDKSCDKISACKMHGKEAVVEKPIVVNELTTPSGFSGLNKLGETDIQKLIGRFIRIVIGVIGTIALLMFVYGGVLWMISAGSAEKTKKAMDIILWSSLGVIVILASYAIVNFVFGLL